MSQTNGFDLSNKNGKQDNLQTELNQYSHLSKQEQLDKQLKMYIQENAKANQAK